MLFNADVATLGAYGTQVGSTALFDATLPVVALTLVVAAAAAVGVVRLLQRRGASAIQPASVPRPSLRAAA
jgi:hypothetical protein